MKNSILIDVDTERAKPIMFSKPPSIALPQNREEAAQFVLTDIACLSEALLALIKLASANGYADKTKLVDAATKTIILALEDLEPIPTQEPDEHQTKA